jgi:hypothetical protein
VNSRARFLQFRSAPAQKALPWPASTIARTSSSSPARSKASVSSAMTVSFIALRTSGRFSQIRATPAFSCVCRVS